MRLLGKGLGKLAQFLFSYPCCVVSGFLITLQSCVGKVAGACLFFGLRGQTLCPVVLDDKSVIIMVGAFNMFCLRSWDRLWASTCVCV